MNARDEKRLEREIESVDAGELPRCQVKTGKVEPTRCGRAAGHPGCHVRFWPGVRMAWGPGKMVAAFYPRKSA